MSNPRLQVLADHRDALLLAEVGAWLHMLGKFHEEFLKGDHNLATDIPLDLKNNYPDLNGLLLEPWTGSIWGQMPIPEFKAQDVSLFDLIYYHEKPGRDPKKESGFLHLMWDAHGRGSGIEKGVLNRFAPGQSGAVYLATAAGIDTGLIDLSDLANKRQALYIFLQEQLQLLRDRQAKVDWSAFRKPFIERLEQDFRATVAETRRPLNDVTLFDQTMASVAFFKAALAQNICDEWAEPNVKEQEKKYRWRILKVGLDGLVYWGQAARANDLLSRKALIDPALDKVRELLEETYPLGMEIYRDENGSLFIAPDIADLLEYDVEGRPLRECINAIADSVFAGEARFHLEMSERTRNTLLFGQLATAQLPPPVPFPTTVESWWMGVRERDICPVCGLRPQGPSRKAMERKVCDSCEGRRTERAREWANNLQTTVWIDEVADANGRAALIVGRFGLESWLRGKTFNTVLAFEPSDRELKDEKRNNKEFQFSYEALLEQVTKALSPRQAKQKFGKWVPLLDDLLLTDARGGHEHFPDIYCLYISNTDLDRPTKDAWCFALSLMRQQPAFARLRRLWETTRDFWESALDELGTGDCPLLPPVEPRLIVRAANLNQFDLGPYHAYELLLGSTALAVIHRNGELLTVDNLRRIARILGAKPEVYADSTQAAHFVKHRLEQQAQCSIEQPSEYGQPGKLRGHIQIDQVLIEQMPYQPVIPVLTEPRTLMAIVPADKAVEIARAVQDKYCRGFGKVQNRLPLFLGLVFFQRKTPLAVVMDAGRRMLEQVSLGKETWQIQQDVSEGKVHFTNGLTWEVPTRMGDKKTDDVWYPYFFVEGDPGPRPRRFQYDDRWLVHVNDLRQGDQVYVTPSRFAYLYLEHTAQRFRFDPQKDVTLLDELPRLMQMWERLKSSGITTTALRGIATLLETKAATWGQHSDELRRLAETTLRHAGLWAQPNQSDVITPDDVLEGRLARCLELYLYVLKQSLKEASDDKSTF